MDQFRKARRQALRSLARFLAASPLLRAQQDPFRDHSRVPKLEELLTAFDFEPVAYAKVPRYAYDYTAYGSETEFTLRRNRQAFEWVKLVPKALGGAASVNTETELLGTKLAYPILISPSAAQVALHPDAEAATYQGATAAANTPMIISNVASLPVTKIAAAAKGPLWFQLYPKRDFDSNKPVLDEALNAGCKVIVVTVDQQASYFERALHNRHIGSGLPTPTRRTARGAPSNPYRVEDSRLWYHWGLFDDLRKYLKAPIVIKGVLTAEDAKLALDHGVDAVYVSNHGGRSLDYAPSSLEVLPEIVDAVGKRVPVLFDSGIRRGEDVLKALALGAKAVCLGRVPRWGLAAYGNLGVQRVLEIVQAELKLAMRESGCSSLASIATPMARIGAPTEPVPARVLTGERMGYMAPVRELVNVQEVQGMAKRKLSPALFEEIGGSDRRAFDRITFRPRLMVDTLKLNLSAEIFGQRHFAPILIGPASMQGRFHPDGEAAMAKGAAAAKTAMVVPAESSQPFLRIADQKPPALWIQINADGDPEAARAKAIEAVKLGATAVCLTLSAAWDWAAIDRFRKYLGAPLVMKGVMAVDEARNAIDHGAQGLILSSYRGRNNPHMASSLEVLPAIVEATGKRVPILIDGSFRRGTDILKALALGARAVLLTRPPLWGLAAYGPEGVQHVLELLQSELGRAMVMCGCPNLAAVTPAHVKHDRV